MQPDGFSHAVVEVLGVLLCLLPRHPLRPQLEPVVVSHVGVVGSEASTLPAASVISRKGSVLVFSEASTNVTAVTGTVRLLACNIKKRTTSSENNCIKLI